MAQSHKTDELDLAGLGYKQELKREFKLAELFGLSFSIISAYLVS